MDGPDRTEYTTHDHAERPHQGKGNSVLMPAVRGLPRGVGRRNELLHRCTHMVIEPYEKAMLDAIVRLSLRAWEPVFASLRDAMGPAVFRAFYRNDWRAAQRRAVESVCSDEAVHVWVASEGARTAGFVALKLHPEDQMGEIYMIAVDPDFQRRGIATSLTSHAIDWFRNAGMSIVMVETGGDPGHAPARRAYESSGFRLLPVARYFKSL